MTGKRSATKRLCGNEDSIPFVVEAAFAYRSDHDQRAIVTGINWAPTYRDPFSELGESGESLSGLLGDRYCAWDEPVALIVHLVTPPNKRLDGEQEAKVIALRLGPPKGYAHWTLRLLARQVVALEIVESISHETVRQTLKKTA